MDTPLTTAGRKIRLLVTLLCGMTLLAGTVWGRDDHFPFGPFRMYSTSSPPDAPAPDTRVEGIDTTGTVVPLDQHNTGIRRAEIEGQRDRYVADPGRLRGVADAYATRNPAASVLVEVRIVIRWHGVRNGRPTGRSTDETVARWQP